MGEFTCDDKAEDKFLFWRQAAALRRLCRCVAGWRRTSTGRCAGDLQRAYAAGCDFADEWRNYPVTLVAENNVTEGLSLVVSLANCWQVSLI